jgi:microcompartment protein CcmK/EutM
MRIGEVIGTITLSSRLDELAGGRFLIVQPEGLATLRDGARAKAEALIAYDELSPGLGARIAFTEGREAAMPFYPNAVPLDVYNVAILDAVRVIDPE